MYATSITYTMLATCLDLTQKLKESKYDSM